MTQSELNEVLKLHKMWLDGKEGGKRADLRYADLHGANLSSADLRGINIDFASLQFHCNTLHMITDDKIKIQYLYHCASQQGEITNSKLLKLLNSKLFLDVVNEFHRVKECGKIERRIK